MGLFSCTVFEMAKAKKITVKVYPSQYIPEGGYTVHAVHELNFFDLSGEKAGTSGTSNKAYHSELQYSHDKTKAQIMTMFGPTGRVQRKDWRYFCVDGNADKGIGDVGTVEKEYEKIVQSKRKKGYKDIDVAQRAYGSDDAKKITKAIILNNTPVIASPASNLHSETERLISVLFGSTNKFVAETLKCPLGQLSNKQIDDGRAILNEAKVTKDTNRIIQLTNDFYSLIPHNLGSGARGQMSHLLLDTKDKINAKEYDLDTLLDAKSINVSLNSSVFDQYKSLDASLDYVDKSTSVFSWINELVQKTRASNHRHLGNVKVLHAWRLNRNNEKSVFDKTASRIAKECGKQVVPPQMGSLVKERPDDYDKDLFSKANVIPLFHGTRTQNITGIIKNGFLIRPSGVVITGAMYGNSLYKSSASTKSINYTNISSSYWAKGNDSKAYLFISDCALGNQLIAKGPYQYTKHNIKPHHSVWAKGGQSGVINDEFMLYDTDQHNIRYILEFECKQ